MTETLANREADAPTEDPSAAAKQFVRTLDRTWRAARTYGRDHTTTRRLLLQLTSDAASYVDVHGPLALLVEHGTLRLGDEDLLSGTGAAGESLPLRLHADGVRELRFLPGVTDRELQHLLEALHAGSGDEDDDDDFVTRMWSRELGSIVVVSAEDLFVAATDISLAPQEHGYFAPPPGSYAGLLTKERTQPEATDLPQPQARAGMVGYDISDAERLSVERALAEERALDGAAFVLEAYLALLRVEQGHDLLARALSLAPSIFDALCRRGDWESLTLFLRSLALVPSNNPAFDATLAHLAATVARLPAVPDRLAVVAHGLAVEPAQPLAPLAPILSTLPPALAATLCNLLPAARNDEQRAVLRQALVTVAASQPDPVLAALRGPDVPTVVELVRVLKAWRQPSTAARLATFASHPALEVRKECVAALVELVGGGDASTLVTFALDPDRTLRLSVLRQLSSGTWHVEFAAWQRLMSHVDLLELPEADQRALFHAIRGSAGDAAVPWFRALLADHGWRHRAGKEHLGLLAADMLGTLGTAAARTALVEGGRDASSTVRKACEAAVTAIDARAKKGAAR